MEDSFEDKSGDWKLLYNRVSREHEHELHEGMSDDEFEEFRKQVEELTEERYERLVNRYGCVPPDTYYEDIGFSIELNPKAEISPRLDEDEYEFHATFGRECQLAVFVPRESGVAWRFQTDGKFMKHPEMEGTLIPIPCPVDPRLPDSVTVPEDYDATGVWMEIEDSWPFEFEDVPAPDGMPQSQEGIRWIRITEAEDSAFFMIPDEERGDDSRLIRSEPVYGFEWMEAAMERPVAIVYQNRD